MTYKSLPLIVCLLTACGTAPSRLYYETTTMQHKDVSRMSKRSLVESARQVVSDQTVYLRHRSKTYRKLSPSNLNRVPSVVLWALHIMKDKRFTGAEADLRIWRGGKTRIPVSIRIDMAGRIKVDVGDGRKAPRKTVNRTPRFTDGQVKWRSGTKDVVKEAFELLHPAEYSTVKSLSFRRDARSQDKRKSAQYVQKNCSADIRIYNGTFKPDPWQFVGNAHKIRRSSVRTVLHEIGHALERRPSLVAFCRYEKAHKKLNKRIKAYNRSSQKSRREASAIRREKERLDDMVERIEDFTENSPLLQAYRSVAPEGASPTVYGESSEHESFAESYSLFRTDPSALGRVMPRVLAWFERGEHIKAMKAAEKQARR